MNEKNFIFFFERQIHFKSSNSNFMPKIGGDNKSNILQDKTRLTVIEQLLLLSKQVVISDKLFGQNEDISLEIF